MLMTFFRDAKIIITFIALISLATLATFVPWQISVPITLICVLVFIIVFWHEYVWYAVVALLPFVGITISLADFPGFNAIPFFGERDAPIADILALLLFIIVWIWIMRKERVLRLHHHIKEHLPGILWYAPFLIFAALTILRVDGSMQDISIHYYFRFVLFSYLAYAALPFAIIVDRTILRKTIAITVWTGIGIAAFGAISLFINTPFAGVWRRVAPFAIGSFAPLGTNHNLLAEVLVYTIPFAWYLAVCAQKETVRKWLMIACASMVSIALLTLARAAWIAILVQGLVALYFLRPQRLISKLISWWPIIVVATLFALYMALFLQTELITSSTASRIDLTRIALMQAAETPFFGKGIGTFFPTLETTHFFIFDYGAAIEAHGFLQKLLFETGVIGVGLFLFFFIMLFVHLTRAWHSLPSGALRDMVFASLLAVIGAFSYQVFTTSYFNQKLWFPVGLALVILYGKWRFTK